MVLLSSEANEAVSCSASVWARRAEQGVMVSNSSSTLTLWGVSDRESERSFRGERGGKGEIRWVRGGERERGERWDERESLEW